MVGNKGHDDRQEDLRARLINKIIIRDKGENGSRQWTRGHKVKGVYVPKNVNYDDDGSMVEWYE